jgi:hypothetical protein
VNLLKWLRRHPKPAKTAFVPVTRTVESRYTPRDVPLRYRRDPGVARATTVPHAMRRARSRRRNKIAKLSRKVNRVE